MIPTILDLRHLQEWTAIVFVGAGLAYGFVWLLNRAIDRFIAGPLTSHPKALELERRRLNAVIGPRRIK